MKAKRTERVETRSPVHVVYGEAHSNQLVARYAAVYAFFLESKDAQAARLNGFIEKAAQANLTGHV